MLIFLGCGIPIFQNWIDIACAKNCFSWEDFIYSGLTFPLIRFRRFRRGIYLQCIVARFLIIAMKHFILLI